MTEENEWDHRSNFNDYDGDQASSVTEAVNTRKMGKRLSRSEERAMLADVELDREGEAQDHRRLRDHFEGRHIPSDYEPDSPYKDDRSNREKLLDGERV